MAGRDWENEELATEEDERLLAEIDDLQKDLAELGHKYDAATADLEELQALLDSFVGKVQQAIDELGEKIR